MSPKFAETFQELIRREVENAAWYLAASGSLAASGLPGLSAQARKSALEEIQHAAALVQYAADVRGAAVEVVGEVGPEAAVDYALDAKSAEEATSSGILAALAVVNAEGDFGAVQFLSEFLARQDRDTAEARAFAARVAALGPDGVALLDLDLEG